MWTTETQVRVRYAETDQMNVVYHGNYAQYFEVARVEGIRSLGLSYREIEARGYLMPLVELHVRYLRPAQYDDLLTIKTEIRELPSEHRIEYHHEVYNEAGKLLTTGRVVLYFLLAATREKTTIPPFLHEKIAPYFQ